MRPRTALDPHSLFDFGPMAHEYDRWYGTLTGQAHDRVQKEDAMTLLRPAQRGDRLLDVGCGTGHWSRFFASLGYAVIGVDISQEMIHLARSHPATGCVFELADACALPFAGGCFDVVAAMAVVAFVSDVPSMLNEMFRCVKRHGSVLIGALNRRAPLNRHRLATGRQPYASGRLLDPEELRHLLQRFGPVRMVASCIPSSDQGRRPGRRSGHRMVPGRRSLRGPFIVAEVRL
jgi:ubiquinone/menaquinone biosynthesis C-methylase UbiE